MMSALIRIGSGDYFRAVGPNSNSELAVNTVGGVAIDKFQIIEDNCSPLIFSTNLHRRE